MCIWFQKKYKSLTMKEDPEEEEKERKVLQDHRTNIKT